MNPFNLLINYVIANSRATFYNVPGNQEITNTALLTGMVSENPLMSYLIIDSKAKIEGEKAVAPVVTITPAGAGDTKTLQASDASVTTTDNQKKINEQSKEILIEETASVNVVTLENLKEEISKSTTVLKEEISKISEAELQKIVKRTLEPKFEILENANAALNTAISTIKERLDKILKDIPAPDKIVSNEDFSNQSTITKKRAK